jgi:hypothetical protein
MNTNLTDTQKVILDFISLEFKKLNTATDNLRDDSLFSYIEEELGKKAKLVEEKRITNAAYDKANENQVLDIVEKMNKLLNRFGYSCELGLYKGGRDIRGMVEYFKVEIDFGGNTKDIFFHACVACEDGVSFLKSPKLDIYKEYPKRDYIESVDSMLKYVADLIIYHKKQNIKL